MKAVFSKSLEGSISIDGSSTVFPISEAVAEEARSSSELRKLRVGVSSSGTGGGFKKFCKAELDITGASRPIKEVEIEACKKTGVEFIELPVAYDGIAVVAHPSNSCVETMSVETLNKIWQPAAEAKITNWKQIDPRCPDMALKLFGPGFDSGTFDYFSEVIMGKSGRSRPDFTKSEDDNVLVTGVEGEKGSLGYFGFAYYQENQSRLKLLKIDSGAGPVAPSMRSISSGDYAPLSRPIFIYVSKKSAERPEVKRFVKFYIEKAAEMATAVGYVPLGSGPEKMSSIYKQVENRFEALKLGTLFQGLEKNQKLSLEDLMKKNL